MFSKYIVITSVFSDDTCTWTTLYIDSLNQLKNTLGACVYAWCHNPDASWENGKRPKTKALLRECLEEKDFGDIATVLEWNTQNRCYEEWGVAI